MTIMIAAHSWMIVVVAVTCNQCTNADTHHQSLSEPEHSLRVKSHTARHERLKHDILRPSVASGCLVKWASCSKLKSTLSWAWDGKAVLLFWEKKNHKKTSFKFHGPSMLVPLLVLWSFHGRKPCSGRCKDKICFRRIFGVGNTHGMC